MDFKRFLVQGCEICDHKRHRGAQPTYGFVTRLQKQQRRLTCGFVNVIVSVLEERRHWS
jgi:hypothetical protein